MTSISAGLGDPTVGRALARYRRLLVLYPRDFRAEWGDDLVQAYGDLLMFSGSRQGLWWRATRDLLGSAAIERARSLRPGGGRSPLPALGLLVLVGVIVVLGAPVLLLPALVLVGLPVLGIGQLVGAWRIRRATGGDVGRHLVVGVLCLVASGGSVVALGDDAGYFVFLAIFGTLIAGAAAGVVWALLALGRGSAGSWRRPALVLVPSVLVLAVIIGASINSYRNSLGPPGDHSVANASADTRALWQAAHDGDLVEVRRLTAETCADPWVKFPDGNGRHNAKGMAEELDWHDVDPDHGPIAEHLGDYMDDWYDRCGRAE